MTQETVVRDPSEVLTSTSFRAWPAIINACADFQYSRRQVGCRVSSPGESHPEALAELYVSLSTHTAPLMEPRRAPSCQWANNSGAAREMRAIQCVALRRWRRSFLYFCLAQRTRSRSSSRIVG